MAEAFGGNLQIIGNDNAIASLVPTIALNINQTYSVAHDCAKAASISISHNASNIDFWIIQAAGLGYGAGGTVTFNLILIAPPKVTKFPIGYGIHDRYDFIDITENKITLRTANNATDTDHAVTVWCTAVSNYNQ